MQDRIASGDGVKPQGTLRGLALHFRIQNFDGSLVDLPISAGFHLLPHGLVNRLEPVGDRFDLLHHLLARNLNGVALTGNSLQCVEGEMIVMARPQQMDGQVQAEPALRDQVRPRLLLPRSGRRS